LLQATLPFLPLRAPERCAAISTLTHPTGIAELVPKRKREISLLAMTERGRAFSGLEDDYNRFVGAGFSGIGCLGGEAEVLSTPEGEIAH
jgi:hypothetical protein